MKKQDRTVWVTGANQGIGRAVANEFFREGYHVIGFDKVCDETHEFRIIQLDLRDIESVKKVVRDELSIPGSTVDVLVHCAGVLQTGALISQDLEEWSLCMDIHIRALLLLVKEIAPRWTSGRGASLVTIASNSSVVPRMGMGLYGASKSALVSITKTLGLELASRGVRCNCVSPGSTATSMQWSTWSAEFGERDVIRGSQESFKSGIPLGKIATPEDVSRIVLFLASEDAGHITMQNIVVDGGATLGVS
jgi:2,3-dihydro-2,3-dihydroxybenzoate dehydrogenase